MVLSDRTIRQLLEQGRIGIEPFDPDLMQPSSLDVRVDRYFRVFRNSRYPYIDVKARQEDLTELVEVAGEEAFILHPGEFVLGSTLERVTLPDDLVARLEGKALALDTEVPTTEGWRTMEELRPGDLVFEPNGVPTVVVAATEPMHERPCREVRFSDGTTVVCDLDHQWVTVDKNGRRGGKQAHRVVTTAELERSLVTRGEYNHQIPLAAPPRYPRRQLTYRIGGAGHSQNAYKVIPNDYLRASVEQREALLAGLMDTDGYADRLGGRDLTTIEDGLAHAHFELVAGLLPRKLARQKRAGRFHRFRTIVDVREVPSVPVRCIQVSAAGGQFLVTRAYIATHNSSLGRLGLLIHSTAGFIDPGWDGHVTLELSNVANLPITIYPGMKIGQLSFVQLSEPAERPYGSAGIGSKYQGQRGPTPSRYWKNFEDER